MLRILARTGCLERRNWPVRAPTSGGEVAVVRRAQREKLVDVRSSISLRSRRTRLI
jgi:hypothetical protein